MSDSAATPYWLYLLECEGGAYYAGIALDVEQRFYAHLFGRGAKFTRAWPPLRVLAARQYPNKSQALRAEARLKSLGRERKLDFFREPAAAQLQAPAAAVLATPEVGPPLPAEQGCGCGRSAM